MMVWTHAVLGVLYVGVLYFCICTCSAQLSLFHMERRSRNTIIIILRPNHLRTLTKYIEHKCMVTGSLFRNILRSSCIRNGAVERLAVLRELSLFGKPTGSE